MYYTYAEKQNSSFFGGWSVREIAFDVTRRYLYYSDEAVPDNLVVPPNRFRPELPENNTLDGLCNPSRAPLAYTTAPQEPHNVSALRWKKKIKVDLMIPIGKEHQFILEDPHLKERDLYQLELHGDLRPMNAGETPPAGPLLCPSTGLAGMPQRQTLRNEEFIRDPDFKKELFESLRVVFNNLRLDQESAAAAAGRDTSNIKAHTIESPKGRSSGGRKKILLRLRNDYEYRRFLFVVQTVLGYDKIIARPYRGLPPYDPRNGIMFSQIPMYVWHTFKSLDRAVIYSFLRGDLLGRDSKGNEMCVLLKGGFLCISHDTVFVMRETGHITRWVSLHHVHHFYFNIAAEHPYFAILSDPGYPDIVFLPQPPGFGVDAIKDFSGCLEVLRVHRVIHDTCFASVVERRVIEIVQIPGDQRVLQFMKVREQEGYTFQFSPSTMPDGVVSCPLPKEQLGTLWREVQAIFQERDQATLNSAAVPLYENNTNEVPLTREQMEMISQRLNRERAQRDQIVGVSYAQAQRIDESFDANEADIYCDKPRAGFSFGVSADGSLFPTSHYITRADLASSHAPAPGEFAVDHHAVIMASTPCLHPTTLAPNAEFSVDGMMATSFSAYSQSANSNRLRQTAPQSHPHSDAGLET